MNGRQDCIISAYVLATVASELILLLSHVSKSLTSVRKERYSQIYEAKNKPPVSTSDHIENLIIS